MDIRAFIIAAIDRWDDPKNFCLRKQQSNTADYRNLFWGCLCWIVVSFFSLRIHAGVSNWEKAARLTEREIDYIIIYFYIEFI